MKTKAIVAFICLVVTTHAPCQTVTHLLDLNDMAAVFHFPASELRIEDMLETDRRLIDKTYIRSYRITAKRYA